MTDAEKRLWSQLRLLRPRGLHFRRQAPIGAYIADFCCHAAKLVIEVDGGQHAEAERDRDNLRTAWLESQGYRVLRFWNNEVLKNIEGVVQAILAVTPPLTPPHEGEGN